MIKIFKCMHDFAHVFTFGVTKLKESKNKGSCKCSGFVQTSAISAIKWRAMKCLTKKFSLKKYRPILCGNDEIFYLI